MTVLTNYLILQLVLFLFLVLQIFLSLRKRPVWGLIMPGMVFAANLLGLVYGLFMSFKGIGSLPFEARIFQFVTMNIPTAILLAIHFVCRRFILPKLPSGKAKGNPVQ